MIEVIIIIGYRFETACLLLRYLYNVFHDEKNRQHFRFETKMLWP